MCSQNNNVIYKEIMKAYNALMHKAVGQIILAVTAALIFVSTAFVIKLTKPIEYKR